jgi:uncharacterized membrane protein YhhN
MPKRALIEKRPWLLASLAAGISFWFVRGIGLPGIQLMAWKGAGVGLLAAYALMRQKGTDANTIAVIMALGALGDVLIEIQLEWGAIAFLIAHLIAVWFYLRHRRRLLTPSQKLAALALLILTPAVAFQLPTDRSAAPLIALYALGLGAMAASAWTSSFSRYQVGLGAVMFVASDLLIFARMGIWATSPIPGLLIWPLYYFGQFLICTGVLGELRRREA